MSDFKLWMTKDSVMKLENSLTDIDLDDHCVNIFEKSPLWKIVEPKNQCFSTPQETEFSENHEKDTFLEEYKHEKSCTDIDLDDDSVDLILTKLENSLTDIDLNDSFTMFSNDCLKTVESKNPGFSTLQKSEVNENHEKEAHKNQLMCGSCNIRSVLMR